MKHNIKHENCIGKTEMLLYDILEELKEINQKLSGPVRSPAEGVKAKAVKITCKKCGKQFTRKDFLNHTKNCKKG